MRLNLRVQKNGLVYMVREDGVADIIEALDVEIEGMGKVDAKHALKTALSLGAADLLFRRLGGK